jgi:hypothetical protein
MMKQSRLNSRTASSTQIRLFIFRVVPESMMIKIYIYIYMYITFPFVLSGCETDDNSLKAFENKGPKKVLDPSEIK